MYKPLYSLPVLALFIFPMLCHGWGFWAHKRINRIAVYTLPPEMVGIYKKHIDFITDHAVDPDKRRYAFQGEAERHYIDLDQYGSYPFLDLPREWEEAVEKYTEDTLRVHGILPWQLPRRLYALQKAFENMNLERILDLSAEIGHYVGDAHVPLHTTKNYNGQLTNQKGIHGFWESRLPELYGDKYDYFIGKSYYIEDILTEGWTAVLESHLAVDSVLIFESELHESFPSDKKYGYENRNTTTVRVYSREYSRAYHEELDGMVERRMRMSILRAGSYWYTAWKNAGSPDLKPLFKQKLNKRSFNFPIKLKIKDRENQDVGGFFQYTLPINFHRPFRPKSILEKRSDWMS